MRSNTIHGRDCAACRRASARGSQPWTPSGIVTRPLPAPWGRLPCPQALVGACWTVGRENRSSRYERPIRHPPPLRLTRCACLKRFFIREDQQNHSPLSAFRGQQRALKPLKRVQHIRTQPDPHQTRAIARFSPLLNALKSEPPTKTSFLKTEGRGSRSPQGDPGAPLVPARGSHPRRRRSRRRAGGRHVPAGFRCAVSVSELHGAAF